MAEWQVAALLLAVVVTVIVATRPSPPRRRRSRLSRRAGVKSGTRTGRQVVRYDRRSSDGTEIDAFHRNHWDRADLAAGVGRDDAVSDPALILWPSSR